MRQLEYANADTLRSSGFDPTPKDGDVVQWVSTGELWIVSAQDDLCGPSALHHWPDGGWCNVNFVRRKMAAHYK